jgi:hypothetical protein
MCPSRYFLLLLLIRINNLRVLSFPSTPPARYAHSASPNREVTLQCAALTLATAVLDFWHFPIQLIVLGLIIAVRTRHLRPHATPRHELISRFYTPSHEPLGRRAAATAARSSEPWRCLQRRRWRLRQTHRGSRAGKAVTGVKCAG